MKLTPIEEILHKIFRKRHTEYEQIAGGKIEPDELTQMLIAEGFAKEPAVRYGEHLKELHITMNMLRTGTLRGALVNAHTSAVTGRKTSFGIPPKAIGGKW